MLYRSQQAPTSNCFIVVASKYNADDDKARFISIFYHQLQRQRNTFVAFDLYTFVLLFALFSFSWLCLPCRAPASMLFRWISILFVLFPFVSVFFFTINILNSFHLLVYILYYCLLCITLVLVKCQNDYISLVFLFIIWHKFFLAMQLIFLPVFVRVNFDHTCLTCMF